MAFCKARLKLKHTAFIALNQMAVVETMYEDGDYQTFAGFRISAVDGSKVQLPETNELREAFGTMPYKAKGVKTPEVLGEHVYALGSILYDVMNRVVLHSLLLPCKTYEVNAARDHLAATKLTAKDLILYDRGYHSFLTMASTLKAGANFLIRCKRASGMKVVDEMLDGKGGDDRIETITMTREMSNKLLLENGGIVDESLPSELRVRFVRITLKNGDYEVLATSVLSREILSVADLAWLYYMRWGIETFYGVIKTRLGLENFSGYSEEAVRQDFFSTVFLCGLESIFILETEGELQKQKGGKAKKVNKAVSFNAIKNSAFELFISDRPIDEILEKLTELFTTSPTIVRPDRNPPRKKPSNRKVLYWWQKKRKIVF